MNWISFSTEQLGVIGANEFFFFVTLSLISLTCKSKSFEYYAQGRTGRHNLTPLIPLGQNQDGINCACIYVFHCVIESKVIISFFCNGMLPGVPTFRVSFYACTWLVGCFIKKENEMRMHAILLCGFLSSIEEKTMMT